eukprot:scaffold7546_cov34-Prasinocladus_malaysianus.AAC.1
MARPSTRPHSTPPEPYIHTDTAQKTFQLRAKLTWRYEYELNLGVLTRKSGRIRRAWRRRAVHTTPRLRRAGGQRLRQRTTAGGVRQSRGTEPATRRAWDHRKGFGNPGTSWGRPREGARRTRAAPGPRSWFRWPCREVRDNGLAVSALKLHSHGTERFPELG